jgi:hypothetical protein
MVEPANAHCSVQQDSSMPANTHSSIQQDCRVREEGRRREREGDLRRGKGEGKNEHAQSKGKITWD